MAHARSRAVLLRGSAGVLRTSLLRTSRSCRPATGQRGHGQLTGAGVECALMQRLPYVAVLAKQAQMMRGTELALPFHC